MKHTGYTQDAIHLVHVVAVMIITFLLLLRQVDNITNDNDDQSIVLVVWGLNQSIYLYTFLNTNTTQSNYRSLSYIIFVLPLSSPSISSCKTTATTTTKQMCCCQQSCIYDDDNNHHQHHVPWWWTPPQLDRHLYLWITTIHHVCSLHMVSWIINTNQLIN